MLQNLLLEREGNISKCSLINGDWSPERSILGPHVAKCMHIRFVPKLPWSLFVFELYTPAGNYSEMSSENIHLCN